ncbi:MAG: hypothetical protein ACFB51_13460 [Anaerolineae bacterium]
MPRPLMKIVTRVFGFLIFLCLFVGVAGSVFAVSTGWVYELFTGLPEPPSLQTGGGLPGEAAADTEENEPRFGLPQTLLPGESVPLRNEVNIRPLAAEIPTPQQVSVEPPIIATNVFLAVIMALIFGSCITILDDMLAEEQGRIQAWLRAYRVDQLLPKIADFATWSANRAIQQGCLTLPIVVVILAVYGILIAFLEEGTSIFTRQGALLAVTMAFSVGIVSFAGDIVRRVLGRLWKARSSFNLYPFSLLIALLTVGVSRVFALTPGIAFGVPGGADVEIPAEKRERREVTLAMWTVAAILFVGIAGWVISGLTLSFIDAPIEERVAQAIGGIVSGVQNTSLLLWMVALETAFFTALPLAYGSGRVIFKWNKFVWILLFVPIAFAFNHVLLNPQSGFLDSFLNGNVRMMWAVLLALAGLSGGLWFYFNVIDDILQEWVGLI